jgi:hypothetical protein
MTTETEKSPRDVAQGITEDLKRIPDVIIHGCCESELIDVIEKALRDRDERVARIIKEHRESDKCEGSCWEIITSAIRGKSNG